MIAKITGGWGVGGLLYYLMGPGKFNEHWGQRVVATWDDNPDLHQPPRNGSACGFDVRALAQDLNDPAVAAGIRTDGHPDGTRRGPVWHCSLRSAPGDRVLSDAEWAEIAAELMARTGIARRGDDGACRWVVVRHAEDHVHIAAMLVRQDNGRRVHPRNDYYRARDVCRDAERRFGLTPTAAADRTAAPRPTRAEVEKAARRQTGETSREWLRRAARIAAVQARDPESFFSRLSDLGVIVRPREAPPGQLVGYAVAVPGDVNAAGHPVWFGGGRLARDLSLPALRTRWDSAAPPPPPIPPGPRERTTVGRAERTAAVAGATAAVGVASAALRSRDPEVGAPVAHATADLLAALCQISGYGAVPVSWAASDAFDRAARQAWVGQPRRWPPVAQELRHAAWRLMAARSVSRRSDDEAGMAELVLALGALVAEIAAYHEARQHLAQANSARQTGQVLHRYPASGRGPVGIAGRTPGRGVPRQPASDAARTGRRVPPPVAAAGGRTPLGLRVPEQRRVRGR